MPTATSLTTAIRELHGTRSGFVSEAFSRLIVEMAGKVGQVALRDGCQICLAWHEAANAFVSVFYGSLLPRRTWVAKPAPRTNAVF